MSTLSNVKYSSILPLGKSGNYTEQQKIQFRIPPDIAYLDGKQSYIYFEVENTSTFYNPDDQSAIASTVPPPVMLQPHCGISGLVRRVQLNTNSGVELEDIDNYNTYVGLLNSYTHDSDEFQTMGLVEGVSGHSPIPLNRVVNKPNHTYFTPNSNVLGEGGVVSKTASFCMPIHLGLFSGLGDDGEKQAYPNLPIGGSLLNLYLDQAVVGMAEQAHDFYSVDASGAVEHNAKDSSELIHVDDYTSGATTIKIRKSVMNFETGISQYEDDEAINGLAISCFKVGTPVILYGDDKNYVENVTVTAVARDGDQLELTVSPAVSTTVAGGFVSVAPIHPAFNISKVELRVLETVPANPRELRAAVNRGINYKSVLLNKLSQATGLRNGILNIPASMTRAMSIFTCPSTQEDLETFTGGGSTNSSIYPQLEDGVSYNWQYQVKQFLLPNRQVNIKNALNNENDNGIHYNQLQMAFRPLMACKCLNDAVGNVQNPLTNPVVIPVMLAPLGSSYRLLDSEPQLRYSSSSASDTKSKLYSIFINHIRTLIVDPVTNQTSVVM